MKQCISNLDLNVILFLLLNLFNIYRLRKMGALDWDKVVHQDQGWRLVSCMWLHAGLIHLLANMICLIFIGVRLEQQFGFCKSSILTTHHKQ